MPEFHIVAGGEIEARTLDRRLFHEARRGKGVVRDGIAASMYP